jgi:hypothetical protein
MLQRAHNNSLSMLAFSWTVFIRQAKLAGGYLSRRRGKKFLYAMEQGRNAPVVEATVPTRFGAG